MSIGNTPSYVDITNFNCITGLNTGLKEQSDLIFGGEIHIFISVEEMRYFNAQEDGFAPVNQADTLNRVSSTPVKWGHISRRCYDGINIQKKDQEKYYLLYPVLFQG